MDGYVDSFMRNGGSFVTLAKGNRYMVVCARARVFAFLFLAPTALTG